MRIKEAAERYDTTKRTLRYYEEIGLIKSLREEGSNYRVYSSEELKKLEVIFLLKEVGFSLGDISEIFLGDEETGVERIFLDKIALLIREIETLRNNKGIIESIITVLKNNRELSLLEILKEQIYYHKNVEGIVSMSQFVHDEIILEFGEGIVPFAQEIIQTIRVLREEVEKEYGREIPLIRVRDVEELEHFNLTIKIRDITIKNENLERVKEEEIGKEIGEMLRQAINQNLNLFEKS